MLLPQILLTVALLLVHGIAVSEAADAMWPAPSVVRLYGLLLADASLLAIWAARGQGRLFERLAVSLLLIGCAALGSGSQLRAATGNQLLELLLVHLAAVCVPMLIWRVLANRTDLPSGRATFRIKDLLVVTTAVALAFALSQKLLEAGSSASSVTVACGLATSTLLMLAALQAKRRPVLLVTGVPVIGIIMLIVMDQLRERPELHDFLWLAAMHAGFVAAGLIAVSVMKVTCGAKGPADCGADSGGAVPQPTVSVRPCYGVQS